MNGNTNHSRAGHLLVKSSRGGASYIGGYPSLGCGQDWPICLECSSLQTFFFKVGFPEDHPWCGWDVVVFCCTTCVSEDTLIPPIPVVPEDRAHVSIDFLATSQRNFAILALPRIATIERREQLRVKYCPLAIVRSGIVVPAFALIGGTPRWIEVDETPLSVSGEPAIFLFQILPNASFDVMSGAPRQRVLDIHGVPALSSDPTYSLFLGNALYVFGPAKPCAGRLFAITQSP